MPPRQVKQSQAPSSPATSNGSWSEDNQEQDIGQILKEVKQKIHAEHKRLTQRTLEEANKYVADVKERVEQAITVTHRDELNEIHTLLVHSLSEQDTILATHYDELQSVEHDIAGIVAGFWRGWKGEIEQCLKTGRGCEVAMGQSLEDEAESVRVLTTAVRPDRVDQDHAPSGGKGNDEETVAQSEGE
ncbi:hypothetical protein IAR55_005367 [Kwoniella newhampshirensis]|uniref:Uncharacterized protein n=1 Tax=Kwoniella newhampshirensis TaxID=1651941 RepID=A0AAW0YM15_9TREE